MTSTWLIVPTYEEAENVESFIAAVLPQLQRAGSDPRLLIVDDGSPDGTGAIADRVAAVHPEVSVLHREHKRGIGPAYRHGFALALAAGADLIAQMDCDLSHDPTDLPRLIAATDRADLVIGSRYIEGGGTVGWSAGRRWVSRIGCAYARAALRSPVRDLTGGFKCFRRQALESIQIDSLRSSGYSFQIETTHRAACAGMTIEEMPIIFQERRNGRSKMSARIAFEALWRVAMLGVRSFGPAREPIVVEDRLRGAKPKGIGEVATIRMEQDDRG